MDKIETMIHQLYGYDDLANEMLSVTSAVKRMICTCDFPGVPNTWYTINPNLRFYTAGFSILAEDPDFYKKLKNKEIDLRLEFYPEESEIELCRDYFAALYKDSEDNNFYYDVEDFFQQEVITTIKTIFKNCIDVYLK